MSFSCNVSHADTFHHHLMMCTNMTTILSHQENLGPSMLDVKYEGLGVTGFVTTPLNMAPNLSECNVSHGGIALMPLAYISRVTPKCRMICRLTPKSCVMYAGLRLAKTFVCCCPDQLNKRLTDSKNESVRRKSCSLRAKSTFVVASSQSQRVAFMTRSARGGADRYVAGSASIIRGD